jgi:brefeldin A-resistance guanine nucleotide exchange factor 1
MPETTMEDSEVPLDDLVDEEEADSEVEEVIVDTSVLLRRQNAIKVIKGEIHNILTVMRTDARYASPLRFVEETVVEDHPLLQSLRELHEELSVYPLEERLQVAMYLTPFCSAISGRDISASVTGCALSSLHKFLLYGFIDGSEGMILITKSLLHCSFEVSSHGPESKRKNGQGAAATMSDDEQVVLKLLSLAALVVRCALVDDEPLLEAYLICGLLDTCLHVSHRAKDASPLLRSAASDSLSQIVLVVFSAHVEKVRSARATILSQLATLVNPNLSTDATCVTSLTLVNIALETMQTITPEEVEILKDDLCKHLLAWSTTNDLIILSLTLRVIFNLFQPMLRNQMKVPLEIFLTSVHIRILDSAQKTFSPEQKEAALESLLEFCQEPSLMQDLYLNYDCDMNCTNLFDSIMATLSKVASPEGRAVMALNKLAVEGILAVIESIARKCANEKFTESTSQTETILSDLSETDDSDGGYAEEEGNGYDNLGDRWQTEETHKVAQERKRKKHVVQHVAHEFNRNNKDWLEIAMEMELFSSSPTPTVVARFLYSTPHLDKTQMGLYLSKGPEDQFPFHKQVRTAFCALFDFKSLSFSESMRNFLQKFRLPGEAQCIDRMMEAFATEMFDQQQGGPEDSKLFISADAVFRMAFSTIMLNTDLHNPGMKKEKRMTLDDFIRNNRGLNDDRDFPESFLTELFQDIKSNELQVQKEFLEVAEVLRQHSDEIPAKHWEEILRRTIEAPFFTPAETAHSRIFQAGVHDRDMFLSISKPSTFALSGAFVKSRDDNLVLKILKAFKRMAKICVFFDLDETFNEILQILLGHGRDYIMSCIALEYAGSDSGQIMAAGPQSAHLEDDQEEEDTPQVFVEGVNLPLPKSILQQSMNYSTQSSSEAVEGCAAHRGLLALDCAFTLIRTQPARIRDSWPTLIECLCALRDARALPDRVIFLDDFADSRGNLLPLSPFAKQSQRRLDEYYRSLSTGGKKGRGWLSMFSPKNSRDSNSGPESSNEKELSSFSHALLQVTKRAKLEQVVLMRPKNLPLAKQTIRALLDAINAYPYFDDPIFEQHAVYSLELALLSLISNRDWAADLYDMFLTKFDSVLAEGMSENIDFGGSSQEKNLPTPFLMERVVVTILRSCIHLYDIPELRPQLRTCLHLLMELPANFTRYIADRMACGMAIFLSQKYQLLETTNEWTFIGDMLDRLAFFGPGRGFVFDGIANTVESQFTPTSQAGDERHQLTLEGAHVLGKLLLKFIFGTYQKDMSLCIPAMLCMENLYGHTVMLVRANDAREENEDEGFHGLIPVPDKDLWQNIAVAYYSVCRNPDPNTTNQGADCFQRLIASTKMDSLPDDTWLTMLHLIVMKQPPVSDEDARLNCCAILGKILLMTIAHLSGDRGNWEDLTDIVNQMAVLVGENLREGRRGTVSPLFESTLQSITFLSNHMVSEEFTGDKEYGSWVSDTLLSELERVGAGGGSVKNVSATQPTRSRK